MYLQFKNKRLDLSQPRVMGILNVTPDSFADGGRYSAVDAAVQRAAIMQAEGADIIDVGGESTRPGAQAVSEQEELDRVIPVIERLMQNITIPISVDTSKPAVMRAAVAAGAMLINDVKALCADGALQAAAELQVPVCLMHMQGEPRSMQRTPEYKNVVDEVRQFLQSRIQACEQQGIARSLLLADPGFGFGKTLQHNLQLLKNLTEFAALGVPLLVGISRKSMIGAILANAASGGQPVPVEQRIYGSLAAAMLAALRGARILRVHDVAPTVDMLRVLAAGTDNGNSEVLFRTDAERVTHE
jgi:dihydropteroate synthase